MVIAFAVNEAPDGFSSSSTTYNPQHCIDAAEGTGLGLAELAKNDFFVDERKCEKCSKWHRSETGFGLSGLQRIEL